MAAAATSDHRVATTSTSQPLAGKVIAITGAASGIGAATARQCAAKGVTSLALADIASDPLANLVAELRAKGIDAIGTQVDTSSSHSVDAWMTQVVNHFGRLDSAANVAGVNNKGKNNNNLPGDVFSDVVDTSDEGWDYIIGINLTGVFYCLRAELRVMTAGASVVNVSSIAGLIGRPGLCAYSASKHGVVGLTKTAAKEVGKRGIRVNAVAPGPTSTPMLKGMIEDGANKAEGAAVITSYQNLPLQRLGTPEEIAHTICFLLGDDSGWTTGQVYQIDGGAVC